MSAPKPIILINIENAQVFHLDKVDCQDFLIAIPGNMGDHIEASFNGKIVELKRALIVELDHEFTKQETQVMQDWMRSYGNFVVYIDRIDGSVYVSPKEIIEDDERIICENKSNGEQYILSEIVDTTSTIVFTNTITNLEAIGVVHNGVEHWIYPIVLNSGSYVRTPEEKNVFDQWMMVMAGYEYVLYLDHVRQRLFISATEIN